MIDLKLSYALKWPTCPYLDSLQVSCQNLLWLGPPVLSQFLKVLESHFFNLKIEKDTVDDQNPAWKRWSKERNDCKWEQEIISLENDNDMKLDYGRLTDHSVRHALNF